MILQASSPAISATLFDSSHAQRLQNQSICAWIVCRFNLYRSFLSLRYRRSMAGLSQRARSTSSCRRRYHEHRHMHDNTPADFYYVLFQVAADTREEKVLPGALGHGACLGSLHACGGAVPWPLPVWAWKYGTIPDAAPAAACDVAARHSVCGLQHGQGGTGW